MNPTRHLGLLTLLAGALAATVLTAATTSPALPAVTASTALPAIPTSPTAPAAPPRLQASDPSQAGPLPASPAELVLPPLRPHRPQRPAPTTLACGARLVVIEDPTLPLVDGTLLFPGGSVHEDAAQIGLTAIMAETLRQGGSSSRGGAELDTWLDRHAVDLTIEADHEFLRLEFSCLAEDLAATLTVIGDLLASPAYPEEDLQRVRRQLLTALERRADDAGSLADEVIEMLAYGSDSPWARQPTSETLAAVDRESLVRFHRLHIARNRAIVGLSGSVDRGATGSPATDLRSLLEATLSPLPQAQGTLSSPPRPFSQPRVTRVHILDRPGVPQTELRLAGPGVRRLDPDYSALRLWSTVVGSGGMTSRLMMRVRTELGLAYTVGGFFGFGWGQAGRLYTWCGTRNEAVGEALSAMLDVLEGARAPFPEDELEAFRRRARNKGVFFNDTPAKLLRRTLYLLAQDYPADFDDRWPEELERLSAADLSAAATRHLDPDSLVVLAVGPAQEIRAALLASPDAAPFFIDTTAGAPPTDTGSQRPEAPRTIELVFVDDHGRPAAHTAPPAPQPPLVDELLEALGGRATWASARYMEASLAMILPDGRELPSHQWKDLSAPRISQTITLGGVDNVTVLANGEAWTRTTTTLTQLEPETVAQMTRAHDRGLWNLLHRLATNTDVSATANPDGSLQLSTPTGFAGRLDLDEAHRPARLTFMESRRRQIFDFSEYQTEAGLTYPALAKQSPMGTSIRIHTLTPHKDLPPGIFDKP